MNLKQLKEEIEKIENPEDYVVEALIPAKARVEGREKPEWFHIGNIQKINLTDPEGSISVFAIELKD